MMVLMLIMIIMMTTMTHSLQDGVMYKPGARFYDEATDSTLDDKFIKKKHLPSFDLMKIRETNEKLAFPSRCAALEISWLLCLNQNRSLKNPSKFSARPTGGDIDDYDDIGEADKGTPP